MSATTKPVLSLSPSPVSQQQLLHLSPHCPHPLGWHVPSIARRGTRGCGVTAGMGTEQASRCWWRGRLCQHLEPLLGVNSGTRALRFGGDTRSSWTCVPAPIHQGWGPHGTPKSQPDSKTPQHPHPLPFWGSPIHHGPGHPAAVLLALPAQVISPPVTIILTPGAFN